MKKEIVKLFKRNRKTVHYPQVKPLPDTINVNELSKWIMHESNLATLLLDIEIPYKEMFQEAMAQEHLFVKHRGDVSPGWSSMAIHGTAVDHTQPKEYYFKENAPDYSWTELAELCPVTKQWIKSLEFDRLDRVRFMKLDPGGYIDPHRDTDVQGIHAWNVALNNPQGHVFVMDGYGYVPWSEGQVRGIDVSKYHSVVNNGTVPRIHMIIHGAFGNKFRKIIVDSYKKIYEEQN